jgi:hypothetical protein
MTNRDWYWAYIFISEVIFIPSLRLDFVEEVGFPFHIHFFTLGGLHSHFHCTSLGGGTSGIFGGQLSAAQSLLVVDRVHVV